MSNIKSKHLFKIIVGSSLSLVVIAPTLTLTSCAKISQYTMPIMTGGTSTGDGIFGDITTPLTLADPDEVAFNTYLPTQFDTYIDSSTGGQPNAYVYAKPDNVNSSTFPTPRDTYDAGWYNYADPKLAPNKTDKSALLSYKNLNIADLASSTSSIVYNLTSLINTMLSFVKQPAILTNQDNFSQWMSTMFTSNGYSNLADFFENEADYANHVKFYSMFFSLLNILDEGKQGIKFDISNSDFKFQSWAYGPGPLIDTTHISKTATSTANDKFFMVDNASSTATAPTTRGAISDAYIGLAKNADNTYYVPTSMPYGIPTLLNLGATKYAYFNPLDKHSYDQRDWLINDIDVVKNRVQDSSAWNTMGRLTGQNDKTQWVPSLTYTVNPTRFDSSTATTFDSKIKGIAGTTAFDGKLEPSWANLMASSNNLAPNTFFAMSHYGIASYHTIEGDFSTPIIRNPVFSYISSVFPTYLLYNDGGDIDESLFTEQYPANELGNEDWQVGADKLWYFDETKANEKMAGIINYLKTNIMPGQTPPTDQHLVYCLRLFQRIFGAYNGSGAIDKIVATGDDGWINIP